MLMGPVSRGGEAERTKEEKKEAVERERAEARGGDQGMDVFTLYPLFF